MDEIGQQIRVAEPAPAKSQVEALFDSLALEYVRERDRQFSFISQKHIVIEMLGGAQGRLLEVGCGPAVMAPDLLSLGFEVQGIDVSGEMIRRARQRMTGHLCVQRCSFSVGDVERLQFASDHFDAVVAMGVLEYLPTYKVALREISRVLKPGGIAVFTVPNRASAYHLARSAYDAARALVKRLAKRSASTDGFTPNRCLPWRLDQELAQARLHKIESRGCNFIFFPLKELQHAASEALNRRLMPLSRSRLGVLIGSQYIVKLQKAA